MRITYDPEADAAYVHLTAAPLTPGRDSVVVDAPDGAGSVVVDWKDGRVVGLEVLGASGALHPDLLARAVPPG